MVNRQQRRRSGGRRFYPRRKVCQFCVEKVAEIDYKDVPRLRRFISDWGKIESRRKTGTCAPHQRQLSLAIKRARFIALLPYTGGHSLMDLTRFEPRGEQRRRPEGGRPEARTEASPEQPEGEAPATPEPVAEAAEASPAASSE